MAKRNLNWTEIEARYKSGESPATIAKDYKDCTRAKISQKATRSGWTQAKDEICNRLASEVLQSSASELKELCNLTTRVHLDFMKRFYEKDIDGETMFDKVSNQPFLMNGERHNPLFQTAMNNATKIMLALYGKDEDTKKSVDRVVVEFKTPNVQRPD